MDSGTFSTVLGHPRVITGSLAEARHRVLAYDGDEVVGVAVFEPLFGRQAEGAIAVVPGSPSGLISYLFDSLIELAGSSGISVLRYALGPGRQRSLAARLTQSMSSQPLRSDRLELHLGGQDEPADANTFYAALGSDAGQRTPAHLQRGDQPSTAAVGSPA